MDFVRYLPQLQCSGIQSSPPLSDGMILRHTCSLMTTRIADDVIDIN